MSRPAEWAMRLARLRSKPRVPGGRGPVVEVIALCAAAGGRHPRKLSAYLSPDEARAMAERLIELAAAADTNEPVSRVRSIGPAGFADGDL